MRERECFETTRATSSWQQPPFPPKNEFWEVWDGLSVSSASTWQDCRLKKDDEAVFSSCGHLCMRTQQRAHVHTHTHVTAARDRTPLHRATSRTYSRDFASAVECQKCPQHHSMAEVSPEVSPSKATWEVAHRAQQSSGKGAASGRCSGVWTHWPTSGLCRVFYLLQQTVLIQISSVDYQYIEILWERECKS